jgi:peptide/nickel transport system ATP-binding protein
MDKPLVSIEDLHVTFKLRNRTVEAVRGVSLTMGKEKIGIVGESGSGKSVTGRALLGLVPAPGEVRAKRLEFDGQDLRGLDPKGWRALRGKRMAMVMQDPKFSLNPVMTVGKQIAEAYRLHVDAGRSEAKEKALAMLDAVRIDNPGRVYDLYPHEVSGGMGQRAMIAMMLVAEPDLLIADEPTSALDVTVQMQVLAILDELVDRRGMGLIFVSHDLDLVAAFCDRVLVMYGGRVVETLKATELHTAQHPYTQGLLNCVPRLDRAQAQLPVLARQASWMDAP